MSLNFINAWRNDKYNKIVLIWRFTLVLIKINYGQIGDQTGLFHTTNPIFYTSGNRFVRRTGTFGNLIFSLVPSDTVIQDLLVRHQFSLVPDNRTNVNVEAWKMFNTIFNIISVLSVINPFFSFELIVGYCKYQQTDSDTENYRLVWHQTHYDATDKNNKVSSEGRNDNGENVCLYFHNWHYSIYIMQVTFIHGGSEKKL
jgi:hypothetical protein